MARVNSLLIQWILSTVLITSFSVAPNIQHHQRTKTTGINSIPLKILQLAKEPIAEHLCNIYNLLFTIGIFPDSLKIASVTPIYKNGPKRECANYKPISLPTNPDKIIQKLMHKRLMGLLNDQKVLYKKQFGFQTIFSTAHAIITLI